MTGLRLRGSEPAATTSRPPFYAYPAQPMRGSAVEASRSAEPERTVRRETLYLDMIFSTPALGRCLAALRRAGRGRRTARDYAHRLWFRQRRIR